MSKKTTILTVIIAAVLLLAVVAIAMNAPDKKVEPTQTETSNQVETTTPTTQQPAADERTVEVAATIAYTDSGFEPSAITVKAGDTIRIENKSSMPLSFNSDDHPAHTDHGELNVGDVPRGGSRDFVITKTGTWGYHNHENATHSGKIVVE